ncbi:CAP domain-containing protein [Paracoccus benzoatiresistens]|uniref:CAP domain-containing protein n=1 Tax=Paracoccus benzoatiresistens TaxID=2997341 RepID=A0ABT4J020_9RHOB|nr:CAP domain-containing protein [Paracoccus sp. EF6]MCZ0960468.1 CAP domain-containing protein [Paracoccus sp. EF6]
MTQTLGLSAAALLSALLAGCAQTTPDVRVGGDDPHDMQLMPAGTATCLATSSSQNSHGAAATNAMRRNAGLPLVQPDPVLAQVAAQHACDMAKRGRMTHRGSSTSGPGPRVKAAGYAPMVTAENIAAGPFSQERVLAEWNASSGHLANMLIPQVRDYGIGQAIGPDGKTRFWAAIYAAPR